MYKVYCPECACVFPIQSIGPCECPDCGVELTRSETLTFAYCAGCGGDVYHEPCEGCRTPDVHQA